MWGIGDLCLNSYWGIRVPVGRREFDRGDFEVGWGNVGIDWELLRKLHLSNLCDGRRKKWRKKNIMIKMMIILLCM